MKSVSGKVSSSKPISLSKAAKILSNFVSVDNGASQAVQVYLRRASSSFGELVQVHKDIKSSHSDKKIDKKSYIHNKTLEIAEQPQQVIKSSHFDREKQPKKVDIHNETRGKADDRSENVKVNRKHKKHPVENVTDENRVKDQQKIEEFDERRVEDERKVEGLDEKRDNVEDSVRKRDKKAKKHKGIEREDGKRDSANRVKDQHKIEELDKKTDNAEEDSWRKRDKKAKKHKGVEREDEGILEVEEEEEEEEERKEKKNKKRKNREADGGELVLDSAEQSGLKKKKRKIEVKE